MFKKGIMAFSWFKKKENKNERPDFSAVDSNEKAIALYEQKQLVKIHLMPLEFGGDEGPLNTLYAPGFVRELKARFDRLVEAQLEAGKKLGYSAKPEYKGNSFIPSKLVITVTGEVQITETIEIW